MVYVNILFIFIYFLGFLVNFISAPVLSGFTSAAAIITATSQIKVIFLFQLKQFFIILIYCQASSEYVFFNSVQLSGAFFFFIFIYILSYIEFKIDMDDSDLFCFEKDFLVIKTFMI